MNRRISALAFCALSAVGGPAFADAARTEFEQRFIGREWTISRPYENAYPSISADCVYNSNYSLHKEKKNLAGINIDVFRCGNKWLHLLTRTDQTFRVKALDALVFPQPRRGEQLLFDDNCELEGRTDQFFFALVRFGKREIVDWKTGVRKAWIPNPVTGKFEELPIRNIVCWRPTPP